MSSSWCEWDSWQCLFFLPLSLKVGADNTFTLNSKKKKKRSWSLMKTSVNPLNIHSVAHVQKKKKKSTYRFVITK